MVIFPILFPILFPIFFQYIKSDNYRYRDSWKSDNFRERELSKESKELIQKRMQRGLRVITLQGSIDKSPILLSQYWKF